MDVSQNNGPNYFKTLLQQEGLMISRDTIALLDFCTSAASAAGRVCLWWNQHRVRTQKDKNMFPRQLWMICGTSSQKRLAQEMFTSYGVLDYFLQIDSHASRSPVSIPNFGRGHASRRRVSNSSNVTKMAEKSV
ncbi:hypothetical protein K438DRAFT_1749586 [Mycena galopus ATCC 62051]|nr:hypothetical protein K438DRAFT_1749586 [Mycena galopus ATCC 62051]